MVDTKKSLTGGAPWVIVAGGLHYGGGMDKANAALANYLADCGTPLHLVAHHVEPELANRAGVTVHRAPRPAGSFLLGESFLARYGRRVARTVSARHAQTRVVVNGGNCNWPDINWVHYVHHAWPFEETQETPALFRAKERMAAKTRTPSRATRDTRRTLRHRQLRTHAP